jgi:hypothetical protein
MLANTPNSIILSTSQLDFTKVKQLGAKWDNNIMQWYITEHHKEKDFLQWMPPKVTEEDATTLISAPISIIRSYETCLHCSRTSKVWGFSADRAEHDDDKGTEYYTDEDEGRLLLRDIGYLPEYLLTKIQQKTQFFFLDKSKKSPNYWYYANHCEHCGTMFSDDDIFHPGNAFIATQQPLDGEISIEEITYDGEFKLDCAVVSSDQNLIWENAERIS